MDKAERKEMKEIISEVLESKEIDYIEGGDDTFYITNDKFHLSAANPKLQLEGTEAGSSNLSIRENTGITEIYDESTGNTVMTIEDHQARHQNGGADEIATLVGMTLKSGAGDTIEIREDNNSNVTFYNTTDTKTVLTLDQDIGVITTNDGTGQIDGVATTSHQTRHSSGGADEITGIAASQMAPNTIKMKVPIQVADSKQSGLAADTTGTPWTSDFVQKLDPQNIDSSILRASWTATESDSVEAIDLYDETAGSVLGSVSGNSATDTEGTVTAITAGNSVVARARVTSPSTAGTATFDVQYVVPEITYGVS